MKVSLNIIKQYIDFELPPVDELVAKINSQLGGVEDIIDLKEKYEDVVIVKVVACEKHPNADRLSVTKIDDGGKVQDVPRDENGYVQVVCGATNVRNDMFAVWLPPKSIVPSSFDDKEKFVLKARELRGVLSQGMLAAADELAIGSDHDGILEIDANEWKPNDIEIKAGASFAKAYELDDTVIDIENKMFTHRPDLFGQLGVAREISAILGKEFDRPEWYWGMRGFEEAEGLELNVFNEAAEKVPRFMAVALKNVTIKPSPLWLQCELVRLGSKPINNIVDTTNYVMLLTSQPTHAYDYDKLRGRTLGTRHANPGEKITLLNDKTYELDVGDIVVVDGEGPVGLGGIMGGHDSEVSVDTKNIVIECATFDMYAVRKTSMRHGLFTEAVTRFNKGQSPLQNDRVLSLLMSFDSMSGEQASPVSNLYADSLEAAHREQSVSGTIKVEPDFINARLGFDLTSKEMEQLLRNVSFSCYVDKEAGDTSISFTAPFWRTDIEIPEDIVEEIGRLYGFDKLPRELPTRSTKPPVLNSKIETKQKIRESLARSGANEVLTYSFVHEKVMQKAEQDVSQAFKLSNALSPDLQYYRLNVLPSLLDKVHANVKAGYNEFALFEIGKGHNKKHHKDDDEGLPAELEFVDMIYAKKTRSDGAAYYKVRRMLDQLANDFNCKLVYKPIVDEMDYPITAPFDQTRSALIETTTGIFVGMIGELKSNVVRTFKLPEYAAAATLDVNGFVKIATSADVGYTPLSRFPIVERDICFQVSSQTAYQNVETAVDQSLKLAKLKYSVRPLDIYQPDNGDTKNITFRLHLSSLEKTLTSQEASAVVDAMVRDVIAETSAVVV